MSYGVSSVDEDFEVKLAMLYNGKTGMVCVFELIQAPLNHVTHCGQVMPCGDIDLGNHMFR